jgi:hypothetical protein
MQAIINLMIMLTPCWLMLAYIVYEECQDMWHKNNKDPRG